MNRKYADSPEPDPVAFLRRYGHHVRRVPMVASQLTCRRLRRGLARMHPSALGLDGWSLADLRSLPDQLLAWLADLLREVERVGRWPARLAEGYTALIPKEGPPGPLNTRPLTVLSMVYRLWASIRLADAIAWQESWAHPSAFGFRPARSAMDGAAVTQVLLELCRLRRWAVAGMSIDYVKCFDLIPQAVVLALALELGMDPGTCRALGSMYKQLRRAFKVAGALGSWWRATNGILQGCPLSVVLVNVLTTIWKWEIDSLRRQVCAATAGLPPVLAEEGDGEGEESVGSLDGEALPPLEDAGPGYAALGSSGYADDTQAVALGVAPLQDTVPATEEWLRITGQDVRVDKSCSSVQGEDGAPAVLLRGVPIPVADTFRQLGIDVAIGGSRTTGPVLARRLESGRSALRRLPHLATFDRRARAVSTLVTPLSLHGVAVASVADPDLGGFETAVLRAVWGATRLSRAKEVVFTVLTKGHRVSPIMHTRYERVLWLTRVARRPGVTQVLTQAVWEQTCRPPCTGPVGRALQAMATLGWRPREGWWCWDVPGQDDPLHLVQEPLRLVQHRVRESLRCHASRQLEARRPITFGGLGDGADGPASRAAMRVAATELERSLLRGLLAGALWTAARVRGHRMRDNSACPHCGAAHEDEVHILWDCPEWEAARAEWRPWLMEALEGLPQLGPPPQWPPCLRRAGLMPLLLSRGMERALLDEFLYRLYGMYLAVLAARIAAGQGNPEGPGGALFPEAPRPRPRHSFPWSDLVGPLPREVQRERPQPRPGVPQGWRWPQDFLQDVLRWARALSWPPGPGEVSWVELALDYEAFVGRALPAAPDHKLRGARLPLGERARVLRKAVELAGRHLAAGSLLRGRPVGRCRSLLPLGGRLCAGLSARPYFAARHEVQMQLLRLADHCRNAWIRRLRAPARMRPAAGDRFLADYFPRPLEGGQPLLPYARRPPRMQTASVPLAAPQRHRPPGQGRGTVGAVCMVHNSPSCPRCTKLRWGISRCCSAGHEGHRGAPSDPVCPPVPRVAPGRRVLLPEEKRAGAAAMSAWLGRARPASEAVPHPGPDAQRRRTAPPRVLGVRPSPPPAASPPRPPKRPRTEAHLRGGGAQGETSGGRRSSETPPPESSPPQPPQPRASSPSPAEGARPAAPEDPAPVPPPPPPSLPRVTPRPPPRPPHRGRRLPPRASAASTLPAVFGRISAALSGRAPQRGPPPPTPGSPRRPPLSGPMPSSTSQSTAPLAVSVDIAGGLPDPNAGAPTAPPPTLHSRLPQRQHGRASTEET